MIDLLNILLFLKLPILMFCQNDLELLQLILKLNVQCHLSSCLDQFSADAVLSDNLINLFQQMAGCLQHLASQIRQDIKFSVNQLSRRA